VPITTHAFHRGDALGYYVVALSIAGVVGGTLLIWNGRSPDHAAVVWLVVAVGILLVTALLTVRMATDLRRRIRATRRPRRWPAIWRWCCSASNPPASGCTGRCAANLTPRFCPRLTA